MKRTPSMSAAGLAAIGHRETSGAKSIKADPAGVVNAVLDAALATITDTKGKRGFRCIASDDKGVDYWQIIDFNENCIASCIDEAWAQRIVYVLNHANKRS